MGDDEFVGLIFAGTDTSVLKDLVRLSALLERAGRPQAVCPTVEQLPVLFVLERIL